MLISELLGYSTPSMVALGYPQNREELGAQALKTKRPRPVNYSGDFRQQTEETVGGARPSRSFRSSTLTILLDG
jgi:hypothetical protein